MTKSLFSYGTLQSPRVLMAVAGKEYQGVEAVLLNYAIFRVRGTVYPGIIPAKGNIVRGLVYRNIADDTFRRLDDFEGEQYERIIVSAVLRRDHSLVRAYAYRILEGQRDILSSEGWDLEHFLQKEAEGFIGTLE